MRFIAAHAVAAVFLLFVTRSPLTAQDEIDVTPTMSSVNRTVGQSGLTNTFEIENTTGSTLSLTIGCEPETTVVCTDVSPSNVVLAGLEDTLVVVTYSVPTTGAKSLMLGVTGDGSGFGSMTVNVQDPYTAPLVDSSIHNGTNVDLSRCVLDCLHGTLSYTTPAYPARPPSFVHPTLPKRAGPADARGHRRRR